MKFPIRDFAPLEQRLGEWGVEDEGGREEIDTYFNAPDRDFARTDEALRVRCVGMYNFVTYKGPKQDARTKTRTEIEVALAQGRQAAEDFIQLLSSLGYRLAGVVRKRRRLFRCEREGFEMEICLDEVENLGGFAELEIQVPAALLTSAREVLLRAAEALGLHDSERRSYLELLLASRAAQSKT